MSVDATIARALPYGCVIDWCFPSGEKPPDVVEVDFEEAAEDVQETAEDEEVSEDFEEAAAILNKFPRGATALMRVCIQKLVPLLKQDGNYLNDYISSLVDWKYSNPWKCFKFFGMTQDNQATSKRKQIRKWRSGSLTL